MSSIRLNKRRPQKTLRGGAKQIGAAEFKAKCLGLIDEINRTGQELIVTKRGSPAARVSPLKPAKAESLIGRLEGIIEIVGDPDDLIKPVFRLEDYDMLK